MDKVYEETVIRVGYVFEDEEHFRGSDEFGEQTKIEVKNYFYLI
jgi:hypothetical protein